MLANSVDQIMRSSQSENAKASRTLTAKPVIHHNTQRHKANNKTLFEDKMNREKPQRTGCLKTDELHPATWFLSAEQRKLVKSEIEQITVYRKKGDIL